MVISIRVKGNKKGKKDVNDGDEGFQKNTAEVVEEEVSQISFVRKKKGKKGKQSNRDDEDADDVNLGSVDGDDAADGNGDVKKNKKKGAGKAKPKASQADMFSVLAEFEDEGETESTVLDSLPVNDDFNVDESSELVFTGKKKIDEEMEYSVLEANEEDEDAIVVFPGTKKKTKGKNNKSLFANSSFAAALTDEEDTEDKSMGDNIEVEKIGMAVLEENPGCAARPEK